MSSEHEDMPSAPHPQPATAIVPSSTESPKGPVKGLAKAAALVIHGQIWGRKALLGDSPALRDDDQVGVKLTFQPTDEGGRPWFGFSLQFPLGGDNEEKGFGLVHAQYGTVSRDKDVMAESYRLQVRLPSSNTLAVIEPPTEALVQQLPSGLESKVNVVKFSIRDTSLVHVGDYGKPFANAGSRSDAWVNKNEPLVGSTTLLDLLRQNKFTLIVKSKIPFLQFLYETKGMPQYIPYPYGTDHSFSFDRYISQFGQHRGPQWSAVRHFADDNEAVSALTQSEVQDRMWLHQAAERIGKLKFRGYFVEVAQDSLQRGHSYYAIIRVGCDFLQEYAHFLMGLAKNEVFKLRFFEEEDHPATSDAEEYAAWDAKIAFNPSRIPELSADHPTNIHMDIVLRVRQPGEIDENEDDGRQARLCIFEDRARANDALESDKSH